MPHKTSQKSVNTVDKVPDPATLELKVFQGSFPNPINVLTIPTFSLTQVIDKRFLDHLDLSYAVNTDKYEKHRALHLGKAKASATMASFA
jgi:hypothetical protein